MKPDSYSVGMVLTKSLGDTPEEKQAALDRVNIDAGGTLDVKCSECGQEGLASMAMIMEVMRMIPENQIAYTCIECMEKSAEADSAWLQVPTVTGMSLAMIKTTSEENQRRFCMAVTATMIKQGLNTTDDVDEDEPMLKVILEILFGIVEEFFADPEVPDEDKTDTRMVFDAVKALYHAEKYRKAIDFYTSILIKSHGRAHMEKHGGLD